MKKLLVCASLMAGYTGLSYGMDMAQLKQDVANKKWQNVVNVIIQAEPAEVPKIIKALYDATTDQPDCLQPEDQNGYCLFDSLLISAAAEGHVLKNQKENASLVIIDLWKNDRIYPGNHPKSPSERTLQQEISRKASEEQKKEQRERKEQLARSIFQRRCVIAIPFAVAIVALVCAVYWWKTQKVDKGEQEEDANQDAERAVVDVQIQNPVAV